MISVDEINQIQQLYEKYKSIRQVSKELGISRNTVKKYLESLISVQEGNAVEIVTINRKVKQPKRVLTDDLISLVHSFEKNVSDHFAHR